MATLGMIPLCEKGLTTDPRWVVEFVQMLEREEAESVWMPEHVVVAEEYEPLYDYSEDGLAPMDPNTQMPDPLDWLTFAAAHTNTLRLGTGVLIGPQHSAAILAKRLATIDALSAGRLEVGIGIGWQKEEYEAVGVPYNNRGRRLDEALDAMRALWRDDPATFHGEFINFDKVYCDTKPAQADGVPFLIGGSSDAAARRAGLRGNGFFPYTISPDELVEKMQIVQTTAIAAGRDPEPLSVTIWPSSYNPEGTFDLGLVKAFADAGADRFIIAAFEAEETSIEGLKRLVCDYQDKIMSHL
jgi:probable F420-dependent oxidoreductase